MLCFFFLALSDKKELKKKLGSSHIYIDIATYSQNWFSYAGLYLFVVPVAYWLILISTQWCKIVLPWHVPLVPPSTTYGEDSINQWDIPLKYCC